ncbi:hypothetical protein LEP1GSC021_0222 [Leptospira noguchii str. 1993005606]|nr:hypothetical protein LEP1GSC021_0222 [Leptospira noguchii str. 1993005606]
MGGNSMNCFPWIAIQAGGGNTFLYQKNILFASNKTHSRRNA